MDRKDNRYRSGGAGAVYVIGLVGALVYYIHRPMASGQASGVSCKPSSGPASSSITS